MIPDDLIAFCNVKMRREMEISSLHAVKRRNRREPLITQLSTDDHQSLFFLSTFGSGEFSFRIHAPPTRWLV